MAAQSRPGCEAALRPKSKLSGRIDAAAVGIAIRIRSGCRAGALGGRRRRGGSGAMMMMAPGGGFEIRLQAGKSLLRAGQIAGLQIVCHRLVVRVRLAVFSKRGVARTLRIVLQRLLKSGERALSARKISGLEGAAESFEILERLFKLFPL